MDNYTNFKSDQKPLTLTEIYTNTLNQVINEIEKYYDDVDKLWGDIILEYKNNINSGVLLDKLTYLDKDKFYDLMGNTPTIKSLTESYKRLNNLTKECTR